MRKLAELNLNKKRCLVRVDFNVPLIDGDVQNDFRIRAALPTIRHCLQRGASVVLMSHLGRPKGKVVPELSLEPVASVLERLLGQVVQFSTDCISEEALAVSNNLGPGQVHLLENLRFHPGETDNDSSFSERLAKHGNIYINDAFGTAHRPHASNVGVLDFFRLSASGFLLEKERKYLSRAIQSPKHPFVVILGGAKVTGKIELIHNLLKQADKIIIGGAMAFTFLKVSGKKVGNSKVEEEKLSIAKKILSEADKNDVEIILPVDVVAAPELDEDSPWRVAKLDELEEDESGFDIGPETSMIFESHLDQAGTILWNGPLGVFEIPAFSTGTHSIAHAIINETEEGAVSIVGGGDTASAIESLELGMDGFTHISTGGGASLELLSGLELPAFKALDDHE
ncbi:MAG: phosphoglycerate kinase [FCB group bacterium]|nr:phosphoglycerate kinase [FCB group bacterium]